jgi:hypothetical protein
LNSASALTDRRIGQLELGGDRDHRQRIEHVVLARQVERHVQVGHGRAVAALAGEAHLASARFEVHRAHLGVGPEP